VPEPVQSGAELDTLQTRRDLQDDPLARAALLFEIPGRLRRLHAQFDRDVSSDFHNI
jgi:hypothetical protein